MSTSDAPAGETLEHLVARLLRTTPQTWAERDVLALSEMEERALFLLVGAGMIERRMSFRLQMLGHPTVVEATIAATGEYGLVEAVGYILSRMQNDWREVFAKHKASDLNGEPAFHCERIGNEHWRLTGCGLKARDDLDGDDSSTVLDFILKRGFFDGRARLRPDGSISRREPVRGRGRLEKIELLNPGAAPAGTHIMNWKEGVEVFAAVFAELRKERPGAATDAGAPGEAIPSPTKPKRSAERGKCQVKLIAALTKHHKYADGGCLNLEPIGNNELAKAAGVSASTASAFFNDKFQGHTKYKALCRDAGKLIAALKLLNNEFAPHNLYGRRPASKGDRDGE